MNRNLFVLGLALCAALSALPASAKKPKVEIKKTELVGSLMLWKDSTQTFRGSPQGLAVYKNTAVLMRDGGQVNILDLRKKQVKAVYKIDMERAHCNNAGFGPVKYSKSSVLPLLYVTECYGKRRCFVLDLGVDGGKVVQEIYYDDPQYKGPLDWAVDAKAGFIYAYGGPEAGRFLKKFRLPSLSDSDSDGKVVLTAEDVLSTTTFTGVKIPQGSLVRGQLGVIPDGCPPYPTKLHFIDMGSGEEVLLYDLKDFDIEPEGVALRGKWIYMSFFSKDKDLNTNIYRLKIR